MIYLAAFVAVTCFAIAFEQLGVGSVARRAIEAGVGASRVMRDTRTTDDEKERAAWRASMVLLRCFGAITVRSAAALLASLLPLLALHAAGVVRFSAVNGLLLSWGGVLLATATAALVYVARARA
jgi:hypothetical protein